MSEKGVLSKSIASNISEAIIDKLGGTGYAPNEWSKNINLLGIASADIENALASITEDTSSADKGLLSLSIASDVGAMLNKKYNTSRGFKPCEVSSAVSALTVLPEKTASSAPVCVFNDGADDVPLKSCEVALSPSLDGYSSVDVVSAGKNLVNIPDSEEITRNQLTSTIAPLLDDFLHGKKGNFTISAKTAETVANANFITIRINYTDSTYSSNAYIYRGSTHESGGITGTFSISSDPTKTIDSVSFGGNTGTAKCAVSEWQVEANSQATAYSPYVAPTTHTASLGRTIYGGTPDVVKGEGQETCARIKISDLNWTYYTGGTNPIFYAINVPNMKICERGEIPGIVIDGYVTRTAHSRSYLSANMADMECSAIENAQTITFRNDAYTSVSDMLAVLGNEYIVYELDTPTDFTFEPVPISSRLGNNTMWSEQGDTEVTYRADLDLYEAPSTLLGSNNTETEGNEEQEVNE